MGVSCDWVYFVNSCCTSILGVYSDWVYNANWIVGTKHMLKTTPMALWMNNALCIVGVSGNHDSSDPHMLKTKLMALWMNNALCIVGVSGNHDSSDTRVGEWKIGALFLQCNQPSLLSVVWNYLAMNVFTVKRFETRLAYIASYIVFTVVRFHHNSFSHRLTAWKEFSRADFIIFVFCLIPVAEPPYEKFQRKHKKLKKYHMCHLNLKCVNVWLVNKTWLVSVLKSLWILIRTESVYEFPRLITVCKVSNLLHGLWVFIIIQIFPFVYCLCSLLNRY